MKVFRRILPHILNALPDFISFKIIRKMISIDNQHVEDDITIKVAENIDELEQAFKLVQESYADINLADLKQSPLRVNKYHALPTTAIIILKKGDKVIATLSVITSNKYKLPLESLWNIDTIKNSGRTAEVSSLAVAKDYRKAAGKYTVPLMLFLNRYSFKQMGIKNFVISINPKAAIFYRGLFNFKYVSKKIKRYEFVNNAPAICLTMKLDYWQDHIKKDDPFHEKITKISYRDMPYFKLPCTKYHCALGKVMTPKLLDYFFIKKTSAIHDFKEDEIVFLKEVYNFKEYQDILKGSIKAEKKYFIYCHADLVIGSDVIDFDTFAVNENKVFGKLYKKPENELHGQCIIKIDISRKESLILKGQISSEGEYYSVKVERHENWDDFVHYIKTNFYFKESFDDSSDDDNSIAA